MAHHRWWCEMDSPTSSSSEEDGEFLKIHTPHEILKRGLIFAGHRTQTVKQSTAKTNRDNFLSRHGADPEVLAIVFECLQRSDIERDECDRIPPEAINLDHFFVATHFLRRHEEERERAADCGWHRDTCQDRGWFHVERIKALKNCKIVWPEFEAGAVWVMTVNGQHCWMHEPSHPEWSQDKDWFSHKCNKAGVGYELGISLTSGLIWLGPPCKAGRGNREIFREEVPRDKLWGLGKKAIEDGGCHAEELFDVMCLPNAGLDSSIVKKFKRRALRRNKKFNGMMKTFDCLDERFRHSQFPFSCCFEAVADICQCQLELELPLFNVSVERM